MSQSRVFRLALLVVGVALFTSACGGGKKTPERQQGGVLRVESSEPDSLDANTADDSEQIIVVRQLYRGLVDYDPKTARVTPALATRTDISSDAKTFTFHLRKNSKFSNGEPVDAQAFVRGWSRATSKSLASPVAYHLSNIVGYKEQQAGTTQVLKGIEAVDQYTIKVSLTNADAEFSVRLGHPVFAPAPSDAAIAGQKPSWAEFPIGNGPFKLKEPHKHNQVITLVPNENYYGTKPFVAEVQYRVIADFDTAYTEWQAGNLDWSRIPGGKIQEAKAANVNKFIIRATAGINYLSVSLLKAPTNNKNFRVAVSQAIDRQSISKAAFAGLQLPATGIIPPALPGYRKPGADNLGPCKYCKFDKADAKAKLDAAKAEGVDVSKPILLSFNGGAGHEIWVQAVQKQLQDNLGLKITLKAIEPFSKFIEFRQGKDAEGLMRNAWGMDFPTPENFLYPLFDSRADSIKEGGDNTTHYANPAFDKLIDQARAERDGKKRLELYQQAEDLVLADVGTIPMWWRTQFRLAALDKFSGLTMDAFEDPTVHLAFLKAAST